MRGRLRDILARPAATATGPRRRDVVLVAVLMVSAAVESALRTDLAWPVATALVTIALLVVLPWRRNHPLPVVAVMLLGSTAFETAQVVDGAVPNGLGTMFAFLLVPYALFRWGSGRDRLVGGALLIVGLVVSIVFDGNLVEGAIAGTLFVGGASLLGAFRREQLGSRARQLEAVRAAEREALARDLHDTVAHHVSAIAIRAQAAGTRPDDTAHVTQSLGAIEQEARAVLTDMRSLVRALRAPAGLAPSPGLVELEALAEPGPPVVTVRFDQQGPMPEIVTSTLFRIAQEAITNARRHAVAVTAIDVNVTSGADEARIVVRDDGTGSRPGPRDGHGLRGIAERAALLGGDVDAGPDPDGGWTVRARLPMRHDA